VGGGLKKFENHWCRTMMVRLRSKLIPSKSIHYSRTIAKLLQNMKNNILKYIACIEQAHVAGL
jgi:hypothetical protein